MKDLKGNAAYLKKNYIMDENDSLSEYNKISLGQNRTNGAVYSKNLLQSWDLLCTLEIRWSSHASFPALILLNPNKHYNHGSLNTFDYSHYVYIVTI